MVFREFDFFEDDESDLDDVAFREEDVGSSLDFECVKLDKRCID